VTQQPPDEDPPPVVYISPRQLKPVRTPYSVREVSTELVRASLALLSLFLLIATVVLAWLSVGDQEWADAEKWLQIVLPAETAILGSALGFYFGDRRRGKDKKDD